MAKLTSMALVPRISPFLGSVLLLLCLTGCSPADRFSAAVAAGSDSQLQILFELCPGARVNSVQISEVVDGNTLGSTWAATSNPASRLESMTAFDAPVGWTTVNSALSEILPGKSYILYLHMSNPNVDDSVIFSTELVSSLAPNEVISSNSHQRTVKMTEDRFSRNASNQC